MLNLFENLAHRGEVIVLALILAACGGGTDEETSEALAALGDVDIDGVAFFDVNLAGTDGLCAKNDGGVWTQRELDLVTAEMGAENLLGSGILGMFVNGQWVQIETIDMLMGGVPDGGLICAPYPPAAPVEVK